ncbi:MAG: YebC/PmpR family DNA-binding transcriptional regulator [Wolbachia endosymbiont of Fragariocoptes setiger]|nr:YebC/PmpR family DNA-binding transcriptional regulator [Wolbachia endosymbiont of Fragariocoptes setiger]
MAGHSQFSNIKHRKGAQDAKRSQRFTKLIREIIVAAKQGGPDSELNPRLRAAIVAARKENLPKDKIEAAIKSVTGNVAGENYEEVQYEGYGPAGTALIVHALTNNRNRTASEMRYIFSRKGGNLGEEGSVNYLFDHVGLILYKKENVDFEDLFNYGIELEVLDVELKESYIIVTCKVHDFGKVRDAFYKKFGEPEFARLSWLAKEQIEIRDKDLVEKVSSLVEELENNDDVQYVEGNFNLY